MPDTPASHDEVDRRFARPIFAIVVLLAGTSGIVDALAFERFGVFVANQTGNLVIVALGLAHEQATQTRVASIIALVTFTVGVFLAVALRKQLRKRYSEDIVRVVLLSVEAALIASAGISVALWGEVAVAYVAVGLLSLSQAVQSAVITRIVGMSIQTVVINTALVQSANSWAAGHSRAAAIALGTPIGYLLGAFCGALLLRLPAPTASMSALVTSTAALVIAHRLQRAGATFD